MCKNLRIALGILAVTLIILSIFWPKYEVFYLLAVAISGFLYIGWCVGTEVKRKDNLSPDYGKRIYWAALFILVFALFFIEWARKINSGGQGFWTGIFSNVGTELIGIVITIVIVNYIYDKRSEQEAKSRLIFEMGNSRNDVAVRAVDELYRTGWLQDGTLSSRNFGGANLTGAQIIEANLSNAVFIGTNFQNAWLNNSNCQKAQFQQANLSGANLIGSNFSECNFWGARLNEAILSHANLSGCQNLTQHQLARTNSLLGTTMPDGTRYDGRFNLPGDIHGLELVFHHPEEWAIYYGVSLEEYTQGQEWANQYLEILFTEIGE